LRARHVDTDYAGTGPRLVRSEKNVHAGPASEVEDMLTGAKRSEAEGVSNTSERLDGSSGNSIQHFRRIPDALRQGPPHLEMELATGVLRDRAIHPLDFRLELSDIDCGRGLGVLGCHLFPPIAHGETVFFREASGGRNVGAMSRTRSVSYIRAATTIPERAAIPDLASSGDVQ
jgi:hypothetical protein